jgi:hypothetical protein
MSTLKTDNLSNVAGTSSTPILDVTNGVARAWVNFNGTGTVAIRAGYNVSSITDNGTGDYTVNFTNAMPDVNYSFSISSSRSALSSGGQINAYDAGILSGSLRFETMNYNAASPVDCVNACVAIFR